MRVEKGARVKTPHGNGVVAYVRMAPPDWSAIAAVSVILDKRTPDPRYSGAILRAEEVELETPPCHVPGCEQPQRPSLYTCEQHTGREW